jgi:hypothetical protein
MTLEEFLRKHVNGRFSLKVSGIDPRWMKIYIHPDGEDGETLDFYVFGERLVSCDDFEAFPPVPKVYGFTFNDSSDDDKLSAEEMLRCGLQEMS